MVKVRSALGVGREIEQPPPDEHQSLDGAHRRLCEAHLNMVTAVSPHQHKLGARIVNAVAAAKSALDETEE